MTDHELVEKTVEIIVAAYRDETIDFTGFGSQCDWIGYQVRHLYSESKRLPEAEGQIKFDLSSGTARDRQTQFIDNGHNRNDSRGSSLYSVYVDYGEVTQRYEKT